MPITTTPSGGPQGEFSTYTPIYATTLSSNTLSITFSNIPTTFTDLVLVVNGKSVAAGSSANGMRSSFNNDSSALYSETGLTGDGTSASSYRLSSTTYLNLGDLPQASGGPSANIINIMNYSNPNTFKTVLTRNNTPSSGVTEVVGLYRSTSPITSMTLTRDGSTNIASGTTFTLYGIKAAATQFIPTKASGGDIVASDGTYAYHAFRTSGVFTPAQSLSCDVLVVAGGGGGGTSSQDTGGSGGGGAGALRAWTSQSLTATGYVITVGAGGTAGTTSSVGSNGVDSQFSALSSSVGGGCGGGGVQIGYLASNGGSGGGGKSNSSNSAAGTGTTGGNNGGAGYNGGQRGGGGGGGAGAVGTAGAFSSSGAGGVGLNTYSSWATATNTGENGYYAGGGGGGEGGASVNGAGAGGLGGGGRGNPYTTGPGGASGTANTGGGGGGGGGSAGVGGSNPTGNAGGSGIVIVRYTL